MTSALAQIVTDGSVGPATALSGPDYRIAQSLGSRSGDNLFHSFQRFGLAGGESATFTGSADIARVISRVTGGQASDIDGLLRSEVGNADFYFINPAGIVFGPNARIDVPAGFHVGAADEIRFADGGLFSAAELGQSSLSVATPESFGYLGPQNGTLLIEGAELTFADESPVSLSAGDIAIRGASMRSGNGRIRISAVGDESTPVPFVTPVQSACGDLRIDSSSLQIDDRGTGRLELHGGGVEVRSTTLFVDNVGMVDSSAGVRIVADTFTLDAGQVTADALADGDAGSIEVTVSRLATLTDGGSISSSAVSAGNGGRLRFTAGDLVIDGEANPRQFTGFASVAAAGSTGRSGAMEVQVDGLARLVRRGQVLNVSASVGDAGPVRLAAGELLIDGQGQSESFTGILGLAAVGGEGDASAIEVIVDGLASLLGSGRIASDTLSRGNAGGVQLTAGELLIDNQGGPLPLTGITSNALSASSGDAGRVAVVVAGAARVVDGGLVSSTTFSDGDGGQVWVTAGELLIDGRGTPSRVTGLFSDTLSQSNGDAGGVWVEVDGLVSLLDGGKITSTTSARGDAGPVRLAAGELRIDGKGRFFQLTGIFSDAGVDSSGNAGAVEVDVDGLVTLIDGAEISTTTSSEGDAGQVRLTAGELRMDNQGDVFQITAISSLASVDSSGNAGSVEVIVDELASLVDGARITTSTLAAGDAGQVRVSVGELLIDDNGGFAQITGISSDASVGSAGNAGTVEVQVNGLASLLEGAGISSQTFSQGDAGQVTVSAGELLIDGKSAFEQLTGIFSDTSIDASGDAGRVEVRVDGLLTLVDAAQISSATFSDGDAGQVWVTAGELLIDDRGGFFQVTGIFSNTVSDGLGNAGTVEVVVDGLASLIDGAQITSDTSSEGNAGAVRVTAGELWIDDRGDASQLTGISSNSFSAGVGNAGSIDVFVDGAMTLIDGAQISSSTFSGGDAGQVRVAAGELLVDGRGNANLFTGIFSQSGSQGTGDAGQVEVSTVALATLRDGGRISSEVASDGQGGDVSVTAGAVLLDNALVTTSVGGEGRGGDIAIRADGLIMEAGFIQANTGGVGDRGGDILVDVDSLITRNALPPLVGGNQRAEFLPGSGLNVIQAAAPGGEQGEIQVTAPELDLSAGLSALSTRALEPARLAREPCTAAWQDELSSLVVLGRGGLPQPHAAAGLGAGRLERLLREPQSPQSALAVPPRVSRAAARPGRARVDCL